jgi:nicotinamidase/pyrazinamidase
VRQLRNVIDSAVVMADGNEIPAGDLGLRDAGVEHVVAVGLATDYCINATALDAIELGYRTDVLVDACAPVDLRKGDGDRAVAGLEAAGVGILKTVMR